ncbi:MAG: CAP domain-containing protein [Chitinophagales bacterium]|nr:CAP domain-containing protein [Chitinophagales bacterium]
MLIATVGYSPLSAQLSSAEKTELKLLLSQRVNDMRDDYGLPQLKFDRYLGNASQIQADYMARMKRLTHEQRKENLSTAMHRVLSVGGSMFVYVEENILVTSEQKAPFSNRDLKSIAWEMFNIWKESSLHYDHIINPEFEFSDFGFSIDPKSGKIYAVQLLGKKGIKVRGQLSKNGFGLKNSNSECNVLIDNFSNHIASIGNSLQREENNILFWHHNKGTVEQVIRNKYDGIAVDILKKNQFKCGEDNFLDMSPLYDGMLLEPVYKKELMDSNRAVSDFRLITPIGRIPKGYDTGQIQFSIILIKDGRKCAYAVPAFIPFSNYDLLPVEPKIYNPEAELSKKGIVRSEVIKFNFIRNEVVPTVDPELKINSRVHSVDVLSFASVEGDSYHNTFLHEQRGKYILDHVAKSQGNNSFTTRISSKENWDKCYFQLEKLGLDNVIEMAPQLIKEFVVSDSLHNWDSLLYIQRKSQAVIHYVGTVDSNYHSQLQMNLRTAIIEGNDDVANTAMAEMYRKEQLATVLLEEVIFEKLLENSALVQNSAALFRILTIIDQEKAVEFVKKWLVNADELSIDAIGNLLYLYAYTSKDIIDTWDVHARSLAKVIKPSVVKPLVNKIPNEGDNERHIINYHLAAISYYGQINNNTGIIESFNYITEHYRKKALDIEDEIELCLFFNSWSRFDLTIDFLNNRISDPDFNEEAAFLLAQTSVAYDNEIPDKSIALYMKKAMSKNPRKWCQWVSRYFQTLRNDVVKKMYCEQCSKIESD